MSEATRTVPHPLDAFETAKSQEPIWTVQGGDPLGAPLLRIWSHFARIQAGAYPAPGIEGIFEQILRAANSYPPENKDKSSELLVRASATEEISWLMDDYLKGFNAIEVAEVKQTAMDKLDLYDVRRRMARRISGFFSELNEYKEELIRHGWMFESLEFAIFQAIEELRTIERIVNVKRKVR
jgi:hypothetical protein